MTPMTPSKTGCKASVYRGIAPLHPYTKNLARARARETECELPVLPILC